MGTAAHLPMAAGTLDTHLYNPLKHMSQGEIGYSHVVGVGVKSMLQTREQKEDNIGTMQIFSSIEDLNTPSKDCPRTSHMLLTA